MASEVHMTTQTGGLDSALLVQLLMEGYTLEIGEPVQMDDGKWYVPVKLTRPDALADAQG